MVISATDPHPAVHVAPDGTEYLLHDNGSGAGSGNDEVEVTGSDLNEIMAHYCFTIGCRRQVRMSVAFTDKHGSVSANICCTLLRAVLGRERSLVGMRGEHTPCLAAATGRPTTGAAATTIGPTRVIVICADSTIYIKASLRFCWPVS